MNELFEKQDQRKLLRSLVVNSMGKSQNEEGPETMNPSLAGSHGP